MPQNGWHFPFFFLGTAVAGARTAFSPSSGPVVCVRKPNSLALRALVRKPCQGPGHLFRSFRPGGLRTKTVFIVFAGSRTQTLQGPGPLFHFLSAQGSRSKTDFIGFAGSRTQTLPAPGPPFPLFPVPRFAYENRIHWLCGQSYANPAGARTTFSAL